MSRTIDIHTAQHYTWGDACQSWILADAGQLVVKQERMPPGSREQLHVHQRARQFFYVLSGTASFVVGEDEMTVTSFQGLLVLPGDAHYKANHGKVDLEFLVISCPGTHADRINL